MAGGRPARKLAGGRPARRNHRSTAPAPNHIEVAASRLAVGKPVVYMLAVGTTVGKPLLAFWTLEGLLAAVETPVLGQVVFVFESLLAIRAFVWT